MDSHIVQLKPAYTIPEFCRDFAIGRSRAYDEIAAGRLKAFKIGASTRIAGEDALAWRERFRTPSASA